jgi:hypothetical protein
MSAPPLAHPRDRAFSAQWAHPVSADPLALTRPFPLYSLCPVGPPCRHCPLAHVFPPANPWALPISPVLPNRSFRAHAVDSTPTTHAEVAPAPPWPFLATCTSLTLPPPLVTPLQCSRTHLTPRVHQRSTAAVRRVCKLVLPSPLRSRRAHCLGEFRLGVRNSRYASMYPLPLLFSLPALTNPSLRSRNTTAVRRVCEPVLPSPLRSRRAHCLGEFRLGVRNSRYASMYPLPLWFSLPTHTNPSLRSRSTATIDPRPHRVPVAVQGSQSPLSR